MTEIAKYIRKKNGRKQIYDFEMEVGEERVIRNVNSTTIRSAANNYSKRHKAGEYWYSVKIVKTWYLLYPKDENETVIVTRIK